ncbi:MAG: apolipoprotein N-acyltransferase [Ancalomicrobiaceae bacterium]|nr:apolipoprotein N-acyltransferase [Ancalomicrobiaceae bacterium]
MLARLSGLVALQGGFARFALALGAGALAAFAQAPYHAFPVLWVSLPLLVWLMDGAVGTRGRLFRLIPAFAVGWAFGFGYFLNGLWWIGSAFLVDAEQYAWAMPIAVIALPAGLALFTGFATMLARAFWADGPSRIVVLALVWSAVEIARGHVLTGFPWNDLGYGLAANTVMMQAAALVGLHGLTLPAILIFAAPAALDGRPGGGRFVVANLILFIAIAGYGVVRLAHAPHATVPGVKLRLMQPAVTEWSKWRPESRTELLHDYVELSSAAPDGTRTGLSGITHLIWPESPFSFVLAREPWALATIAEMLKSGPTSLITGAVRVEPPVAGEARPRFYNSIYVIGPDGGITAAYDKAHLVPFGEYMPLAQLFEWIGVKQLTQIKSPFSAGPGPRTLAVPGAPDAGMTICYEAVFPGEVVDPSERPGWLVNLTNDTWFGLTPGPYQHLHQARLRSVEEGLPMVRVANSGISAVIDAWGRVVAELPLGKRGVLDADLPAAAPSTLYSVARHLGESMELISICIFTIWRRRRRRHIDR